MNRVLRDHKKGGESLFQEEIIIGSVKAQANRLKEVVSQMEIDGLCEDHSSYYAKEIRDIEQSLRKIRKTDFETI